MAKNSSFIKEELAKKLIRRKSPSARIKLMMAEKSQKKASQKTEQGTQDALKTDYFQNKTTDILDKNLLKQSQQKNPGINFKNLIKKIPGAQAAKASLKKASNLTQKLANNYKNKTNLKSQQAEVIFGNNFIPEESLTQNKFSFFNTLVLFTTPTLALCFTFYLVFQVNSYEFNPSRPEVKDAFAVTSSAVSKISSSSEKSENLQLASTEPAKPTSSDLNIPVIKQIYTLSCEAASLEMALKFYSIDKTQDQLLADFGQSQPVQIKNVNGNLLWGDPDEGFVGDYKGWFTGIRNGESSMKFATGWGINAGPVEKAARKYRPDSYKIQNGQVEDLVKALNNQNPVIFWHVRDDVKNKERVQYYTQTGKIVEFFQNHVNVLRGYKTLPDGSRVFSFSDPYYDTYELPEADLARIWAKMNSKAVVVK